MEPSFCPQQIQTALPGMGSDVNSTVSQHEDLPLEVNITGSDLLPRAKLTRVPGNLDGKPVNFFLDGGCETIVVNKNLIPDK